MLEECNVQYHNEALKYAIWVEMSGFASLPLIRGLVLPWGLLQVSIHSGWHGSGVECYSTSRWYHTRRRNKRVEDQERWLLSGGSFCIDLRLTHERLLLRNDVSLSRTRSSPPEVIRMAMSIDVVM